jgi:hypothetical protein
VKRSANTPASSPATTPGNETHEVHRPQLQR